VIRSLEPELMDSPDIAGPVLDKFHRDLARVHKLLGSFPTIERFIRQGSQPTRSVIDIGCGGGALLAYLRRKLHVEVLGIDPKPGHATDIEIIPANAITDPLPQADLAVSSFLAHHLSPQENIALIRNVSRSCKRFIILDLVRHPMPLWLFTIFICPLIGHDAAADGRQSVRRAYTPKEFKAMVESAIAGTAATFQTDVSPLLSRQIIDIRFAGGQ
jgi:SAM-dependent methyltransferase